MPPPLPVVAIAPPPVLLAGAAAKARRAEIESELATLRLALARMQASPPGGHEGAGPPRGAGAPAQHLGEQKASSLELEPSPPSPPPAAPRRRHHHRGGGRRHRPRAPPAPPRAVESSLLESWCPAGALCDTASRGAPATPQGHRLASATAALSSPPPPIAAEVEAPTAATAAAPVAPAAVPAAPTAPQPQCWQRVAEGHWAAARPPEGFDYHPLVRAPDQGYAEAVRNLSCADASTAPLQAPLPSSPWPQSPWPEAGRSIS